PALEPGTILVTISNESVIHQVELGTGKPLASVTMPHPADVFYSRGGEWFVLQHSSGFSVHDSKTLLPIHHMDYPGKLGVKAAGAQGSGEHFKPLPKLNPARNLLVLNDQSGQLWKLALPSLTGAPVARDVVDYVEDFVWLDDSTVLAINNDTRICRV